MLFLLGRVRIAQIAAMALQEDGRSVEMFLYRHVRGDWGELTQEEKSRNDYAVDHAEVVWSMYYLSTGQYLLVFTTGDRRETNIGLVPSPE